ncbi:hypothetical protein Herbaro_08580 [Herbaspirillum sp. WKF16]|uniref:hypothetical protein n=1 Tax=Herbaspirillum sp. WKF16 TaxID=3028312 RepID=UPI0023A9469D|nr:hypothetical protein [Herbaspirillum sp. WKF16]WDZ97822.1 hypothetical protein Herbaro_08580 [Herbaspirillum sp. WKF16]
MDHPFPKIDEPPRNDGGFFFWRGRRSGNTAGPTGTAAGRSILRVRDGGIVRCLVVGMRF